MRLRIRNFQAVKDATLDIRGVTFLTGLNNQGKSSIIRAFNAAIAGRPGDDHVRHGSDKALVGIELSEDTEHQPTQIAWVKGSKGAEYYINGDKFTKMGRRGVPTEDLEKHGFREIEFSGGRHYLTFDLQDDPHFLVSLPPTQVFDYVSRVLQEREILPVIRVMAEDVKALSQEAKLLEGQIQTRKGSITTWEGQQESLQPILQRADDFTSLQKGLVQLQRMLNTREELKTLSATSKDLDSTIQEKEGFIERSSPGVDSLEGEVSTLGKLRHVRDALVASENNLLEIDGLLSTVESWLSKAPDLDKAGSLSSALEDERASLARMVTIRGSLRQAENSMKVVDVDIEDTSHRVRQAEEEFERVKKEIGVCPVCGSKIGDCDE